MPITHGAIGNLYGTIDVDDLNSLRPDYSTGWDYGTFNHTHYTTTAQPSHVHTTDGTAVQHIHTHGVEPSYFTQREADRYVRESHERLDALTMEKVREAMRLIDSEMFGSPAPPSPPQPRVRRGMDLSGAV